MRCDSQTQRNSPHPAASLRDASPEGSDPFTLAHQFHQRIRVDLTLLVGGDECARDSVELEIFDLGRLGSLYQRVLERLLPADLEGQAAALGIDDLGLSHHPWFPVLVIGADKAGLYVSGICEDLELQRKNLAEPGWLLRVGLYLELLTCLGIIEAVREDYPDLPLLSDVEREYIDKAPEFEAVRSRLNVAGWKDVWKIREIEVLDERRVL